MNKNLWLVMGLIFMLLLAGCNVPVEEAVVEAEAPIGDADASKVTDEEMMPEQLEITYEELAKYTGEESMPAYVAVDGIIYDVTDVPAWRGGKHNGNMAGQDVTDAIKNKSPHGIKNLEGLTVVGKIKE